MSHLLAELAPLWLHASLLAGIAGLLVLELVLPQEQKDAVGWCAAVLCLGLLAASFVVGTSGMAFAGAYRGGPFALFLQRVFLGPLNPKYTSLEEINGREIFCLAPLVVLILIVGVWPMPVLDLMNASLLRLVDLVKAVI